MERTASARCAAPRFLLLHFLLDQTLRSSQCPNLSFQAFRIAAEHCSARCKRGNFESSVIEVEKDDVSHIF